MSFRDSPLVVWCELPDAVAYPLVFAQHPRACRVILDRIDEGRAARSARSLTIHSII